MMVHQSYLSIKRMLCAGSLFFIAIFLFFALYSFDAHDPSYFFDTSDRGVLVVKNYMGALGAHISALLFYSAGAASFLLVPLLLFSLLLILQIKRFRYEWSRLTGFCILLISCAMLAYQYNADFCSAISPGGLVGRYCATFVEHYSDAFIAYVVSLLLLYCGAILVMPFSLMVPVVQNICSFVVYLQVPQLFAWGVQQLRAKIKKMRTATYSKNIFVHDDDALERLVYETMPENNHDDHDDCETNKIFDDVFWHQYGLSQHALQQEEDPRKKNLGQWDPVSMHQAAEHSGDQHELVEDIAFDLELKGTAKRYVLPDTKFFSASLPPANEGERQETAQERVKSLEGKLELFGIKGKVVAITIGPVVTLFEYAPASDVKVSKILALEDDLALALEALSLRIIAPIPGRPVVGFEVANIDRDIVAFSDIVMSKTFADHTGALPLIIGRDTVGRDVIVDLAAMPHLLVAGSTGAGKSVALNAMLTSLLCHCTPDELQLILIDPKRLEFSSFADIAHLAFPIVTDVQRVSLILRWAVSVMEDRYDELAAAGVRNVQEYHAKNGSAAMPYLVIVIDELADLMMTVGKEVEELIARLAQMARAAGIHMIVATQRPSVDVITGLIKVNFPSRIAFKVTSKVDSRTILDVAGAEKLLGRGDMLFLNQRGMLSRVHGAYVQDDEIDSVVSHIKSQRTVEYQELDAFIQKAVDSDAQSDSLYEEVVAFVETQDHVSISLLQRKFRIGYNRSARLMDSLEEQGVIMPADGSKMRKVLR